MVNFSNESIYKRTKKLTISFFAATMALLLLFSTLTIMTSAATLTTQEYRKALWKEGKGFATASNSDMLTGATLLRYIDSNVFGEECKRAVVASNAKTLDEIWQTGKCGNAQTFYQNAQTYGQYVDDRMSLYDIDGSKFDRAMMKLSSLADKIFAVIIGFGLITSLLCFTVIFMTLVWMPDNPMLRRKAMIDIITSGISVILLGNAWVIISLFQSTFQRFWQSYAVYSKDWLTVSNMVLSEYKWFVTGLCGIGTLVALAMFVVNFAGLALAGSNTSKRSGKMKDLLYCAIATAGLGSITAITAFFWNMLG